MIYLEILGELERVRLLSPAKKRKVGSLIVRATRNSYTIMSKGFNHSLLDKPCDCTVENKTVEHITFDHVTHAEESAIMNYFATIGNRYQQHSMTMFCSYSPCYNCMRLIVQSKLFHTLIITDKHPVDFDTERLNGNLSPLSLALRSGLTVEHHHPNGAITMYTPDK